MQSETKVPEVFAETAVQDCYQCGKCTAGCPVAQHMDFMPNRIVRLVQTGDVDEAQGCLGIWYCVSCQTCTTRCPQSVDCAGIMDRLRELSAKQRTYPKGMRRVVLFQQAFLDNVRRNGRVNEVELVGQFKTVAFLKDFNVPLLMKDALLAPRLMQRGKFHLVGEKVRDRGVVRRIFDRCLHDEAEAGESP